MEFLSGRKHLPSIDEMKKDTEMEMQRRWQKGLKRKQAHILGPDQVNLNFSFDTVFMCFFLCSSIQFQYLCFFYT